MGCKSEFGGSPLASSIAVIPNDQMSAWDEEKVKIQRRMRDMTFSAFAICPFLNISSGSFTRVN